MCVYVESQASMFGSESGISEMEVSSLVPERFRVYGFRV